MNRPGHKKNELLWKQYLEGDREAFGKLYMIYHNDLMAYCLGRLKDFQLAENAASETLIKLMDYKRPHEIDNFEKWLFVVARNSCNTLWSTQTRHKAILKENPELFKKRQEPEVELKISLENLKAVMKESLNETEFNIWQLHYEGYYNEEIAEKLKMNPKSVANQKSEVRKKLRIAIKKFQS